MTRFLLWFTFAIAVAALGACLWELIDGHWAWGITFGALACINGASALECLKDLGR